MKNKKQERFDIIKPFLDGNTTLKEISIKSDISYPTLKRWVKSYRKSGIDGLCIKKRADLNSFRKADNSIINKIECLYKKNKEKTLVSLYHDTIKTLETSLSFNTFYRIVNNLDSYLKNKTKFTINKNISIGDIYIIRTFMSYHFINYKNQKKLPIILLAFDGSTLDFIDFHIAFDKKFTSDISSFFRQMILKSSKNYGVTHLPKEILLDSSITIPKKISYEILDKTGIKILDFNVENKEIDEFIANLRIDIDKNFKEENDYEQFYSFLNDYFVYYNLEQEKQFSNTDFEKLNIFLPKLKRKISYLGIRINNQFYNSPFLKKYIGKVLYVIYNPLDFTYLKVFNKKEFIGEIKIK